ncbi:MAG: methyltransferase domain-containing protein [Deltaproteobacteria bacterium]|jgi:predicted nicotinamide N-methyase|nr:methyltransferase domain-containing protein [Deltaproteobacteria bacterium]
MTGAPTQLEMLLDTIREKFDPYFEELVVDGHTLHLLSVSDMQRHLDELLTRQGSRNPVKDLPFWAKVWPASLILGRFARRLDPLGKSLLEVGAGCGAAGLIAARYGFSRVLLTDINEDALLFARANVCKNGLEDRVEVRRADICATRLEELFDFILASEILYLEELHRPLLKFLIQHLAPGGKAVFCADMARNRKRFLKLAARDFSVREHNVAVRSTNDEGLEERRVYALHFLEVK